MTTRIMAMLIAACVLAGTSSAVAARAGQHRSAHRTATAHHLRHRALEPRYDPYAYGAYGAYGLQPGSAAEERWFDQAKGNIW